MMIYLAIPYTGIENTSFAVSTRIAGELMRRGFNVYSPITHSHEIAKVCELPTEWDYWEGVDREYIRACSELMVVCIDGWNESTGVRAEIKYADEIGIPVHFLTRIKSEKFDGMRFVSPRLQTPIEIYA